MKNLISKLRSRKGQGAVEYALITLAVVIIVVAVLQLDNPAAGPLGQAIETTFNDITTQIPGGAPAP